MTASSTPLSTAFPAEAIARLAAGDRTALADCFRQFGARVWRIAKGLLGQAAEADDAVQEVFLKVRERAAQFDGRGAFEGWLRQIAVRHCLDRLAQRRRDRLAPADAALREAPARAQSDVAALEDREQLERALERLPEEFRTIVLLREIGGLSYRELADALEVPIGTVMSRLARARERLLGQAPRATKSARPATTERRAAATHETDVGRGASDATGR